MLCFHFALPPTLSHTHTHTHTHAHAHAHTHRHTHAHTYTHILHLSCRSTRPKPLKVRDAPISLDSTGGTQVGSCHLLSTCLMASVLGLLSSSYTSIVELTVPIDQVSKSGKMTSPTLFLIFFFFFFWPHCTAGEISVPYPGVEPMSPELRMQSLNHWTTREGPVSSTLFFVLKIIVHILVFCLPI